MAKRPGSERAKERKFQGVKRPGNEKARERKGPEAKVPGSELARVLLADSLRGANWPGREKARYRQVPSLFSYRIITSNTIVVLLVMI